MRHDIGFLHTDPAHISTFSGLMQKYAPHLSVHQVVEPELLAQARREGPGEPLDSRILEVMQTTASTGARVVVCTCSTIGAAAERAGSEQTFTAMRIDRAMTLQALQTGKRILVAATVESTLAPTKWLISDSATTLSIPDAAYQVESHLIAHAWPAFEAGNLTQYFQLIHASLSVYWQDFDVILLAQASMAGVHSLCKDIDIPLLSSPASGVQAAIETFERYTKR